jgi:hypothetical protein
VLAVINPPPPAPADDLVAAKEKIAALETKLAEAKTKPTDRAASDAVQMRNKQAIGYLTDELHWARRHLADIESATQIKELRRAQAENPEVSRLWEITAPDGRKFMQSALDAATLHLNDGYEVTAQVFAGNYTVPLKGLSFFDGFMQAHGEELCTYLAERGFIIRRGDASLPRRSSGLRFPTGRRQSFAANFALGGPA